MSMMTLTQFLNNIFVQGLNNLFGEVTWFYPGSGAASNNRSVTYNYMDSTADRPVWTTSSLARSSWADSHIFGKTSWNRI